MSQWTFSSCLITGYNVHMQSGIHTSPESIAIKIKQLHKCDKCNYETNPQLNMEQHLKNARHKLSPDEYIIYRKSKNKKLLEEIEKTQILLVESFLIKIKMYICIYLCKSVIIQVKLKKISGSSKKKKTYIVYS